MILEPEYLDRLWHTWRLGDNPDTLPPWRKFNYQSEYRGGFNQQRFEEWLYTQGFTIVQQNKKRYLKFSGDEKRLTFFLLKHGVTA